MASVRVHSEPVGVTDDKPPVTVRANRGRVLVGLRPSTAADGGRVRLGVQLDFRSPAPRLEPLASEILAVADRDPVGNRSPTDNRSQSAGRGVRQD